MNLRYERCQGTELFTTVCRRIPGFLPGCGAHDAGHNQAAIE